ATGLLHEGARGPERALKALDPAWLARSFALNTIGPALAFKHFAPLLPRQGRSVIGALSARVGSISDNRAGGWYGYRASKAALNMIIRCAAIEIARSRPEALCVGLHPGTVDSGLSQPFQSGVAPGKLFTPAHAAERLLAVVDGLDAAASGRCFAWDGAEIPP
ncbi:MAG: SDR family oxidoreductase, partial [Caulobacteraceae bacterium]|nr:SDR family oxidoreductase [Caulobacter sp.]